MLSSIFIHCHLGQSFFGTKLEALQDWVNKNLIYINAFWVVDCHQCYLNHCFSSIILKLHVSNCSTYARIKPTF